MGNAMRGYGWIGHVLVSAAEWPDGNPDENEVAVPDKAFQKLFEDFHNCKLDPRISVEQLGVTDSDVIYLAAGVGFSTGAFGGIFHEAEAREGGHVDKQPDANYIAAMKEVYGVDLPPCRIMVGCMREY